MLYPCTIHAFGMLYPYTIHSFGMLVLYWKNFTVL